MVERALLESADGLTKELEIGQPALVIHTTIIKKLTLDGGGELSIRRYQYYQDRKGIRIYREVVE